MEDRIKELDRLREKYTQTKRQIIKDKLTENKESMIWYV